MTLIHVIPELRAVHVERFEEWAPDDVLFYHSVKWDMGGVSLPEQARRFTVPAFLKELRRTIDVRVEIPEPLWVREAARTAFITVLTRTFSRQARVFAYCIENNDVEDLVGVGTGRTGRILARIFAFAVGIFVIRHLRGIVFGSPGSARAYSTLPFLMRVSRGTILELPRTARARVAKDTTGVLFVGRLEERKGVPLLMQAWELVEEVCDETITLVGSGPLLEAARQWVSRRPDRRSIVEHIPHSEIGDLYLRHRVLVAPSIRSGRWREQIGLPIKEALSHGLTVVTSAETGLAEWLAEGGHSVLPTIRSRSLADAIESAVSNPLDPDEVASSLPTEDGRFAADMWMRTHD